MIVQAIGLNPGVARAELQSRYDEYMAGRRMLLGVHPKSLDASQAGDTPESRELFYDQFAELFPRRSQRLMRGIAREAIFTQLCKQNHFQQSKPLLDGIAEAAGGSVERKNFGYLSGCGRNAVALSIVSFGGGEESTKQTIVSWAWHISQIKQLVPFVGTTLDPDYGLGDITGRTPEIMAAPDGDKALADAVWENLIAEAA